MIPGITEVNFPDYATLSNATVSLAEMGDRTITTQLHIDGDQVPEYGVWRSGVFYPMELRFRGEPYMLPVREPQASKDNTTRNSVSDLTFYSWATYQMKRYYFFQVTTRATGIVMADKYKASVSLRIGEFCDMLNSVLEYYLGANKIVVDLKSGTTSEKVYIDISYSYIWDVLQKLYDAYGLRWYIEYDSENDKFVIKVGYPAKEIDDHDFEYGYEGGLMRFERQVQDGNVNNVLLGRGGTQNLPYRYFKKTDPQNPSFPADPDAIPELANVHFERLMDANFRWYIRGWVKNTHRDTSGDTGYTLPDYDESDVPTRYVWAYNKGRYTDTVFNPVEFVRDADSIAKYGERWGSLDDNDDIYPTIQGQYWGDTRADTVLAVSPILTDDREEAATAAAEQINVTGVLNQTDSIPANTTITRIIEGGTFVVPEDKTADLLDNDFFVRANIPRQQALMIEKTDACRVLVYDSNGNEVPRAGIQEGTYTFKLRCVIQNNNRVAIDNVTYGVNGLYLLIADETGEGWKPTFDIWIRNIFDSERQAGETDEDYSHRVWSEILGDHLGNEAKVVFSDGPMSISEDYEFKIASYPTFDDSKTFIDETRSGGTQAVRSEWRITLWKCDAELDATGLYIPTASGAKPVAGNHIFFIGIDMPNMYVTEAEDELTRYKTSALSDLAEVSPTWVVQLDKVRIDEEYNESQERLIDKLETGTKIKVRDSRFTGGQTLNLFLQSVTFTWANDTIILPSVDVVLTDKVSPVQSPVAQLQGQIDVVKATYARNNDVETIAREVTRPMYLAKTGEEQTSQSPTKFASLLSSANFRQGGFGGEGWGLYADGTEMYDEEDTAAADASDDDTSGSEDTAARSGVQSVLEVDRLIVRHDMMVNNIVVNQIAYVGGKQIISAAAIECVQVVEDTDGYRCYFDQKQGSVKNLFIVNDVAMGQIFTAEGVQLRFYKRLVTEVGIDYIKLSKTNRYGDGIPMKGDVIVQYGNTQYEDRRYVIIRDVIGGGYEQMLSDLDNVNSSGVEYYFAGMNSIAQGGTLPLRDVNENQLRDSNDIDIHVLGGARPRFFVGTQDSYMEFLEAEKTLYLHGTLVQSPSGITFPVPCYAGEYDANTWYYYGDMVTYNGQSWIHIGKSRTKGTAPINGQVWKIYTVKGGSVYRLDLTNENASINADSSGSILPAAVRPTCTATLYYGDEQASGARYTMTTPSGQNAVGVSINYYTGEMTFNTGSASTPFNFDGNSLEITITATKDSVSRTAVMTVTKNVPGAVGEDAVSYWLVLDSDKVTVNPNTDPETVSPTRVTPTAMLQVGENAPRQAASGDGLSITYKYDDESEASLPAVGYVTIVTKNPSTQALRRTLHFFLKKSTTVVDQESVPILYDGEDGEDGNNGDSPISCFRWYKEGLTPTKPTATNSDSPAAVDYLNDNTKAQPTTTWSSSAPARPGDGWHLWMCQSTKHTAKNGTVTRDAWSNPTRISGDQGTPGEDGDEIEYIYNYSNTGYDGNTGEVSPSGTASGSDTNKNQKDWVPNGWRDNPSGVSNSNKTEYMSFREITHSGGTTTYGAFQTPVVWSHYGEQGMDGDGVEYVYIRTKSATAPTLVQKADSYTDSNSHKYTDDEFLPVVSGTGRTDIETNGGTAAEPECTDDPKGATDTWPYEWVAKRTKPLDPADTDGKTRKWEKYSGAMALWANHSSDGQPGAEGKATRGPSEFNAAGGYNGTREYQGESVPSGWTGGTGFIDIVMKEEVDSTTGDTVIRYYWCKESYAWASGSSSPDPKNDGTHWAVMNNFSMIATKAIVADYANFKQATVRELDSNDSDETGTRIAGAKVNVTKNGNVFASISPDDLSSIGGSGSSSSFSLVAASDTGAPVALTLASGISVGSSLNRVSIPEIAIDLSFAAHVLLNVRTCTVNMYIGGVHFGGDNEAYGETSARIVIPASVVSLPETPAGTSYSVVAYCSVQDDKGNDISVTASYTPPTGGASGTVQLLTSSSITQLAGNGFQTVWTHSTNGAQGFRASAAGAKVLRDGVEYDALGSFAPSGTSPLIAVWKGTQAQYNALGTYYDTIMYVVKG